MFAGCEKLKCIYVSENWTTEGISANMSIDNTNLFTNCTSLAGGKGTKYDENHTDYTYAHIDGGIDNPGYLTYKASTGIEGVQMQNTDKDVWYNLQGIQVTHPQKGIYLRKGKKVVFK